MAIVDAVIVALVLIFLFLVTALCWHWLLGIPYVPTPYSVVSAMLAYAPLEQASTVYDLGAGDGRLLIAAQKRNKMIKAIGFEASPPIWLLGKFMIFLRGARVRFLCRNFYKHSFADADCIFLYLFPGAMAKLERKFDEELRKGTTVISYTFAFPNREPTDCKEVPSLRGHQSVFVYRW